MASEDRRNINLTAEAERAAKEIRERFGFPELLDVVRLGCAYALAVGIQPDPLPESEARGTNYNSATVDGDERLLSALVVSLVGTDSAAQMPYQTIEILMNRGILRIQEDLRIGEAVSLGDLLEIAEAASEVKASAS